MGLLLDESPLLVSPTLARLVGLEEAIFLQQIHYWIEIKKNSPDRYQDSFRDGYWWVFNSVADWQEQMPFLGCERTIKRLISNLVDNALIVKGQYNKSSFDRTCWYRINYNRLDQLIKESDRQRQNTPDPSCKFDTMQGDKFTQTIPKTSQRLHKDFNGERAREEDKNFSQDKDLVKKLQGFSLSQREAVRLIEQYGADQVSKQLAWLPKRPGIVNPPAALQRALKDDWPPPPLSKEELEKQEREKADAELTQRLKENAERCYLAIAEAGVGGFVLNRGIYLTYLITAIDHQAQKVTLKDKHGNEREWLCRAVASWDWEVRRAARNVA